MLTNSKLEQISTQIENNSNFDIILTRNFNIYPHIISIYIRVSFYSRNKHNIDCLHTWHK